MVDYLRNHFHIRICVYLDDFLILNQSRAGLERDVAIVLRELRQFGWTVSEEKCSLEPSQQMQYLGVVFDTVSDLKWLPADKVLLNLNLVSTVLNRQQWSLRGCQKLIGHLNFAADIIPLGRLHLRFMQRCLPSLLRSHPRKLHSVPSSALQELRWWSANMDGSSQVFVPSPTKFLVTDASDDGWGATLQGRCFQGRWSENEQQLHINAKELLAVRNVLQACAHSLRNKVLSVQLDNRTAVAYIQRQGGTKSLVLHRIALELLSLCQQHSILLQPHYLPGLLNWSADALSRHWELSTEWHLLPPAVGAVSVEWGGQPHLDLFASRRAFVSTRYVSLEATDPAAAWTDAYSRPWEFPQQRIWCFPPPADIPRVLHRLQTAVGDFCLVTPEWKGAHWLPEVQRLSNRAPIVIPDLNVHLLDIKTQLPPPQVNELTLLAWRISCRAS
jgi:hypothetical protein